MGRGRGRGRGKGRKHDDNSTSVEDENLPMRRRGRPQKPLKDDIEQEDKMVMTEKEDDVLEETKKSAADNEKKRKRGSDVKENAEMVKEEIKGLGDKIIAKDLIKIVGYRANGSRRKSKPRRAAEVGVECQ